MFLYNIKIYENYPFLLILNQILKILNIFLFIKIKIIYKESQINIFYIFYVHYLIILHVCI